MATSMPPPMVPGFSLRVQLYSPIAHASTDKPVRCFRVVTSPDATVQEFCAEASRIHQINYGEPIAIKKCQDDQEFDITQSEVVGTMFANAATIRVIQATATPGVRDSVPPTSALRFDPINHAGRKRGREGSHRANGPSSNGWQPNKRQRVPDLDPDKPLPSRENDIDVQRTIYEEEEPHDEMIPDSQRDASYAEINGNSRHVRNDAFRVSETPSSPPDSDPFARSQNRSTNCHVSKLNGSINDDPLLSQASIPSPFGPASVRAQNAARSKSASYHIQRATERGTSVSTAATSPLFGDQQAPATNGTGSLNKRKLTEPVVGSAKINGKANTRSENEDSIYDNIPSDTEASSILRRTKDKLKGKSNSPSGLLGLDWAKKFSTPPNGSRRTSRSQERTTANGELPLTPNSKSREGKQKEREQAEESKEKVAAAEAAEQRRQEADEIRAAEDWQNVRLLREKSERETQEKRNAVIAKAARLEQERLQRIKDAEERDADECQVEKERILKGTQEAERLEKEKKARITRERQDAERKEREKQAGIEKERQEATRVVSEKAKAVEAKRLRKDAAKDASAMEETRKLREQSESSTASSSDRRKSTPIRPQSSTPFIPSGRKSALKAPSSQAASSPSPELVRTLSIGSSNGSKNELEVPNSVTRRVSFNLEETPKVKATPIRPPILPPVKSSLKAATPKPSAVVKKEFSPKPVVKHSTTPILPPGPKHSSYERSITPIIPPRSTTSTKVAAVKPAPVAKSISPVARSVSQSRESQIASPQPKKPAKSVAPAPAQTTPSSDEELDEEDEESEEDEEEEEEEDEDDGDDDDEDLDGPSRISPVKALNSSLRSPAKARPERKLLSPSPNREVDEDDGDVETRDIQSNRSSSRSPVVFNSHATPKAEPAKPVEVVSSSDESSDEDESVDAEENSSEEQEDEDMTTTTTVLAPRSTLPPLPKTPEAKLLSERRASQRKNSIISPGSSGNDSTNTQDEVDFQLTSSMFEASTAPPKSTPIPALSSSNAARPKSSFGVTLSSLAKKPIVGASATKVNGKPQPTNLAKSDDESESESEDESDSDSSSDSDVEQEPPQSLPKSKQVKASARDSDESDSDSESGSDKENEDDMEAHRNDLAKQIAEMANGSQGSTQSFDGPDLKAPKASQSSKSSGSAEGGKKFNGGSTKDDKYLTKYQFSQPK